MPNMELKFLFWAPIFGKRGRLPNFASGVRPIPYTISSPRYSNRPGIMQTRHWYAIYMYTNLSNLMMMVSQLTFSTFFVGVAISLTYHLIYLHSFLALLLEGTSTKSM